MLTDGAVIATARNSIVDVRRILLARLSVAMKKYPLVAKRRYPLVAR